MTNLFINCDKNILKNVGEGVWKFIWDVKKMELEGTMRMRTGQ